jgi:hypothetical protein
MPDSVFIAAIIFFLLAAGCVTVNINTPSHPSAPGLSVNVTPAILNETPNVSLHSANSTVPAVNITPGNPNQTSAHSSLTPVPAKTPDPYTKYEVNKRFEEVAFGNEALYLNRWDQKFVKLGVAGNYTREDVDNLNTFVLRFNNESETTKITHVYESEDQEFSVHFVPKSFFKGLDEDKCDKIIRNTETGEILFADMTFNNSWVVRDVIYINSDFAGEVRKYVVLRGLLYDLGFEGYTGDPDSIFFYDARSANISDMDWAVINLMYSKKFHYADDYYSVRAKLT